MTGNDITVNNNGHMVVDGGTAGVVNGDRAILNNRGDAVITNGGRGCHCDGRQRGHQQHGAKRY
ncbi:hypothetical protein ABR759_18590 [Escherichia coli]